MEQRRIIKVISDGTPLNTVVLLDDNTELKNVVEVNFHIKVDNRSEIWIRVLDVAADVIGEEISSTSWTDSEFDSVKDEAIFPPERMHSLAREDPPF